MFTVISIGSPGLSFRAICRSSVAFIPSWLRYVEKIELDNAP
jgi:hypothetical protein